MLKKVLSNLKSAKSDHEKEENEYGFAFSYKYQGICDIIWDIIEGSKEGFILEDMCNNPREEDFQVVKFFGIGRPKNPYSAFGYYWPLTKEGNNKRIRVVQRAIKRIENG